jgi:alkanesulfonate monooxygenase SsuD/methylene tetrahydromethanopterin reductase-like flavin-dependent oxidoreductase (luciferase family)
MKPHGGCPAATRGPTSTWTTGSGWPSLPRARSPTRCSWLTGRRPWARYARADEFLSVTKALWDSWEAEAVVADRATGRYADPARLHKISHRGRNFAVAGPLNVERPPQGYPLLVQAGSSEDGKDFAARHAEAIFTAHQTYEGASDSMATSRSAPARPAVTRMA